MTQILARLAILFSMLTAVMLGCIDHSPAASAPQGVFVGPCGSGMFCESATLDASQVNDRRTVEAPADPRDHHDYANDCDDPATPDELCE